MGMLRRSQEAVESVTQKLEGVYLENKKRFKEKEALWEGELTAIKKML